MTVAETSFGIRPSPSACQQAPCNEGQHAVATVEGPSHKRKEASLGSTSCEYLQQYPANRAYHTTLFHPLVHHTNFSAAEGPVRVGEHSFGACAAQASQQTQSFHHCHHMVADRPRLACDPPISEIQIPTGAGEDQNTQANDEDDDYSWVNGESGEANDYDELSFERLESWKSMYFVAQRDLHVAREESQAILSENRRLKRHLFELQRRLYDSQRKRQRLANDMWKVPGAPRLPPGSASRRQVSSSSQDQRRRFHETIKIQEHHKLMEVGPARLVPRAISSEESSAKSSASILPHA